MAAESRHHSGGSRRGSLSDQTPCEEQPPQPENERPWSELFPEVLNLISKKLPDLPDLVRFRAVCHRWRSAARLSEPRPQLPWFIRELPEKKCLRLYSMCSGAIPKIELPESPCVELMGSAHPYMLAFHYDQSQSSLSLLNPLTGRRIALPPIELTFCHLIYIRSDAGGSGDVVAICGSLKESCGFILGCCRVGDSNWMTVEPSRASDFCCTYHDRMFYVHYLDTKITEVLDPATGAVMQSIPPQKYAAMDLMWGFNFFVESCGDLLAISRSYWHDWLDSDLEDCCFEIHRLDVDQNGSPQWTQMKSIGDRFLFLHGSTGVSYSASDFPGLERNSIYFLGSKGQTMDAFVVPSYLVVFDIEKGTLKSLQCPDDVKTWFLPGLR